MKNLAMIETKDLAGQDVELFGWADTLRSQKHIVFLDLRDRSGIIQVVFSDEFSELFKKAQSLKLESVLRIKGKVIERNGGVNENIPTGKVEIRPAELEVLNEAKDLPFEIKKDTADISEDVRLKYRYLDLRTERLQKNISLRSEFVQRARGFLFKEGFLEIETPALTKSTPEGSRDFVVPSRLHSGSFFALPQSPQQYKQLLMVAGFEKYFQIARCFRDEDLRADRGFEHSQIDIEMSFAGRDEFMALDEEMMTAVVEAMGFKVKEKPFPVFTYKEAMDKFGSDKFDLRTDEEKKEGVLSYAWVVDFPFFEKNKKGGWTFTHNPFSHPKPEHAGWLLNAENIEQILTTQYDLVCNGYEVGGGSIRAHKPELLRAVFKIMGYEKKEIEEQFGHMLEAFSYGAPPHGGIAHGIERNIMTLAGEQYLREVQAFPQTSSGRTSVMDAPSELSPDQLEELRLKVIKKEEK